MPIVETALVLLAAAVIAVPLAKRMGFGSPLGYLAGGLAIGPHGLGLIPEADSIRHVSELGVVMLLFLIGLELRPQRLWVMRKAVFGLGGAQVVATAAVLAGAALGLGLPLPAAIVVGAGLALSSTAIALPLLAERDLLATGGGRDAFSILLFQDLAVIPLLALLPLLGAGTMPTDGPGAWIAVAKAAGAIVVVLVGAPRLVRPLLRAVEAAKTPEIFTAATLLIVLGTAAFIEAAGLSMSLGAFLAGVLLSGSKYRHEVKADIAPFEGLLLGLFFVSVGISADVTGFAAAPGRLLLMVLALVAAKGALVFVLARITGHRPRASMRMAAALGQAGEFGFVLFGQATAVGAMAAPFAGTATLVVTVSMILAPFVFAATERWLVPALGGEKPARRFDSIQAEGTPPVIICGFGRVGQIVGRVLRVRGIPFTALEQNADQVDFVRQFGNKVFYGDPTRPELLRAAGADEARILVVALEDMNASLTVVDMAQRLFPHLTVAARARNRRHAHLLMDRGVPIIVRETFCSSLRLTEEVLTAAGLDAAEAARTVETFRVHDERTLIAQHAVHHDEQRLIQSSRDAAIELQSLFEADKGHR